MLYIQDGSDLGRARQSSVWNFCARYSDVVLRGLKWRPRETSVWNFCARYSDVVLRGLKWRPRETSAVFSGYFLVLFITLLKMVLTFEFEDKILERDH